MNKIKAAQKIPFLKNYNSIEQFLGKKKKKKKKKTTARNKLSLLQNISKSKYKVAMSVPGTESPHP